jgi:hypothetical protein
VNGIENPSILWDEAASSTHSGRTRALFLALVLAVTFLTYLDTLWFQFVSDDQYLILGNPFLRSWHYLPRYFSADVWNLRHPNLPGSYYRPLYLLWFRLNYVVFGTNPWGWHLTTLLAHMGATFLVYRLARRLLGDWVGALFAGLIFGLHPVHIEGAAWVSGVAEPLLAVLLIPSYLCYLRAADKTPRARHWLAASLSLYGLALLVKETALVLPVLIFASQWVGFRAEGLQGAKLWRGRLGVSLGSAAPYIVLAIPYLIARFFALRAIEAPAAPLSALVVICTWPSLLWLYLKHLVWPAGLYPFYDLRYVVNPGLHNAVLPALPVAVSALILAWWARRSRHVALASLWLVLPILPVLDVRIFGDGNFAHDRYLYMPSVGFALLLALLLRRVSAGRARLLGQPALQVALILVLACAMGLSTTSQSSYYANRISYFIHSSEGAPDSDVAKSNLAGLLGEQGHYAEAVKIYQEVLKHDPSSGPVNYNLGYAYYLMGRIEEAEYYLTRAAQFMPNEPDGYFYLGMTQLRMGHLDDAALNIRRALAISPYTDNYHFGLGLALKMQRNLPGALAEFQAELALNPDHAEARQQAAEIRKALIPGQPPASATRPQR